MSWQQLQVIVNAIVDDAHVSVDRWLSPQSFQQLERKGYPLWHARVELMDEHWERYQISREEVIVALRTTGTKIGTGTRFMTNEVADDTHDTTRGDFTVVSRQYETYNALQNRGIREAIVWLDQQQSEKDSQNGREEFTFSPRPDVDRPMKKQLVIGLK
jgi:hypothetical protein